jgi:Resolvase, N terminal domain
VRAAEAIIDWFGSAARVGHREPLARRRVGEANAGPSLRYFAEQPVQCVVIVGRLRAAMGRLFVTIISAIAELERSLVVERVKSGMRRARLEGKAIGRSRLDVNRNQVVLDRRSGLSLTQVAKRRRISRASVCRLMKDANSDQESVSTFALNLPVQASAVGGAQ